MYLAFVFDERSSLFQSASIDPGLLVLNTLLQFSLQFVLSIGQRLRGRDRVRTNVCQLDAGGLKLLCRRTESRQTSGSGRCTPVTAQKDEWCLSNYLYPTQEHISRDPYITVIVDTDLVRRIVTAVRQCIAFTRVAHAVVPPGAQCLCLCCDCNKIEMIGVYGRYRDRIWMSFSSPQ
jgi:hypothetical protein